MNLRMYQVDAFATRMFGGNPAAVVVLERWLPDDLLQKIAEENNVPATAFVIPREEKAPLRWFAALKELDLCGHGTLAAGHVLFRHYFSSRKNLTFDTRGGALAVSREKDQFVLDFPVRPGSRIEVCPALAEALGGKPTEAYLARDILAVFDSETAIRDLKPDSGRIAELEAFGVIATAPGRETDFVSRCFFPRAGIPEDSATGSAHCTLAPYWAARLGKSKLSARQLSQRVGELECELRGDRVRIAGKTVEYLRGEITIESE